MDQEKIGRFIALLRREKGMTQETLGGRLGVSNKTVSRWERGSYMPDLGTLPDLARELGVTVDELLAGERREAAAKDAERESAAPDSEDGLFTRAEREKYLTRKWRSEHKALTVLTAALPLAAIAAGLLTGHEKLCAAAPAVWALGYGWRHNRMRTYVERKLYAGR